MNTDNNNKDERFSKLLSTIEKGKVLPDKQFLDQLRDKSAKEFSIHSAKYKDRAPTQKIPIWRIIMKSKITKLAVAAVIVLAVLIGINPFGDSNGGSSVAFGQVLEYFQTFSYTFDLTVEAKDSTAFTMQAMVWELGRMRVDFSATGVGDVSSIVDLNTGKSLLLFHQNKTAVIKTESVLNDNSGTGGIVSFCAKPIENLWNLRDGTEEQLDGKKIKGQHVTGFKVFQEDKYFEYEITVWADFESGIPVLVEAISMPWDEAYPSMQWTMENFDIDAELNKELFNLEEDIAYTIVQSGMVIRDGISDHEDRPTGRNNNDTENTPGFLIKPLEGVGPVKFGMTRKQIIDILGEPDQFLKKHCLDYSSTIGLSFLVHSKRGLVAIDCWSKEEKSTEGHLCGADFAGETEKGIGINSTKDEIVFQYGKKYKHSLRELPGTFELYYPQHTIIYRLKDNKVIHISLDTPKGYTPAYQEDLENLEAATEPSDESDKIVHMLELWSQGNKNEAMEVLLQVDWTKKIEFGKEPYIFSLTEKGYIALKAKDQKQVMSEIMTAASTMKKIAKQALAGGKTATVDRNYEQAEQYFEAALQLGKLLDRNPESMVIVRLVGISIQKVTLNEMISLYKTTNNRDKLQIAEKQLRMAETQGDEIKKEAMGM